MQGTLDVADEARGLNGKIFSLPRLLLLGTLHNFGRDGAPFRELKASLGLADGVLYANLQILIDMGYVSDENIKFERKEMTAYHITKEGEEEYRKVRDWLKKWLG